MQALANKLKGAIAMTERRYYLSSLKADVETIGRAIREHWGIENKLYWVLKINFCEDYASNYKDHGVENMAIIRSHGIKSDQAGNELKNKPPR